MRGSPVDRWRQKPAICVDLDVCIRMQDGRTFVGRVNKVERGRFWMRTLGSVHGDPALLLPLRRVRSVYLIGSHTYEQRRRIVERQRQGLPAYTRGEIAPACEVKDSVDDEMETA